MTWDPHRPLAEQLEAAWAEGSPDPVQRAEAIVELARRVDRLMRGLRKVKSGLRELTEDEKAALADPTIAPTTPGRKDPSTKRRRRKTTRTKVVTRDPAAAAPAKPPQTPPDPTVPARFDLHLQVVGPHEVKVVRTLRGILPTLSLAQVKALADKAPVMLGLSAYRDKVEPLTADLKAAGATVSVVKVKPARSRKRTPT